MTFNPLRLWRRHRRLQREALDEARHLRRRHGDRAIAEAEACLHRPDLTRWGRRVLARAIQLLRTTV